MNHKTISPQDRKNIVQMYTEKNMTIKEITVFFPFSARITRRVVRESNIPIRHQGQRNPKKTSGAWKHASKIVRMYTKEKLSPRVICKKFNTSTVTIQNILKANNIPVRTLKEARHHRTDKYGYITDATQNTIELTQADENQRVIALRQQDETIQDIASTLNLESKEVYQILLENNALISKPKPKWEQKNR